MPTIDSDWLMQRLLLLPPLLLSLTVHEYAHARTALAFGDPTARDMGRVTLNPLAHLDPMGTLCIILTGMFGWAKPVPVNPYNLHPRRLGDVAVSLAGPLSNILLAVATAALLRLWWVLDLAPGTAMAQSVQFLLLRTTIVNICLCFFNLIPLFPLDGHHIAREALPAQTREPFMRWQMRYGSILLMALIFGPHLLSMVTRGRVMFNPLGRFLSLVEGPLLRLLLM